MREKDGNFGRSGTPGEFGRRERILERMLERILERIAERLKNRKYA